MIDQASRPRLADLIIFSAITAMLGGVVGWSARVYVDHRAQRAGIFNTTTATTGLPIIDPQQTAVGAGAATGVYTPDLHALPYTFNDVVISWQNTGTINERDGRLVYAVDGKRVRRAEFNRWLIGYFQAQKREMQR